MRSHLLLASSLLALGALSATARGQETPAATAAPPMTEPDRARLGAELCTASAPRELGRSAVRNLRLRVASQPGSDPATLAAWSSGEHTIATRTIGAELGAPQSVALDHGMNVVVLAPVSAGRFLAIAAGAMCEGGRARGQSCLRAIGLRGDGVPTGAAYAPEPAHQQLEIATSATLRGPDGSPSGVAVAHATRWGGAYISLFRLDASGQVAVEEHPIRSDGPSDSPIVALASEGEQVVALGVQDASAVDEDGATRRVPFVLALGQRRRTLAPAVPDGALLRWTRARDGELELFYSMPRGRVRWLRVSTSDGRYVGGTPTTIDASDELPAAPVFPSLVVARGSLALARTDLRGARVGQPVAIGRVAGRAVTDWSWDGAAIHAVWGVRVGREWVISESEVRCPTTP